MTILFILFPLLVVIGAAVAIVTAHVLRCRDLRRIDEAVEMPFSVFSIELAFDPDQAIIWETQMPALRLISSGGPEGLRLRRLQLWYLKSASRYPELYDGRSFKQWLAFLEQSHLITNDNSRLRLLPAGSELLHYWVTAHSEITWESELSNSDME